MSLFDRLIGSRQTPPPSPHERSRAQRQAALGDSDSAHLAARLMRAPTALMQLGEAEALTVVGFMQPKWFDAGTTIIRQGDHTNTGFMVLILEGEVTVETVMASRTQPRTLTVLGPGSLIGEMALVAGGARSASCVATSALKCAVLTREALEALTREQPTTAAKLMTAVAQRLAERLRESDHKLEIYSKLVQTMQEEIDKLMPTPDKRKAGPG